MNEVSDEASLIAKRKSDLVIGDKDAMQQKTDDLVKKQKLEISCSDVPVTTETEAGDNKDVNGTESVTNLGDINKDLEEGEDDKVQEAYEAQGEDEDEEDDEDEYEYDDGDGSDESDDDEHSNGNAETVDRKGKGIMIDDKGKGKLIEESVEEDSVDGGTESDGGDSDLSDDPLAEVDLDNILPTRTRSRGGRVVQRGVHISDNQGSKQDNS